MELWQSLKRAAIKSCLLVWLLSLFISLANLAIPLYTLQIFDRVLPSKSSQTLFMLLSAIVILGILLIGSEKIRRQVTNYLAHYLGNKVEPLILKNQIDDIQRTKEQSGKSLTNLQALQQFICSPILLAAMDVSLSPLLIVALFFLHPYFGYSVLICNTLLIILLSYQHHSLSKTEGRYQKSAQQQWYDQQSLLNNATIIRSMGMGTDWLNSHQALTTDVCQKQHSYQQHNHNFQLFAILIRWCCQITVPTIGAYLLIQQQISPGVMLAALMISMRCIIPFETLINGWQLLLKSKEIFNELKDLFNSSQSDQQVKPLTRLQGYIEVKALKIQDKSQQKLILNINHIQAEPGSFTAVIGQNGAGKTLFLQSLFKNIVNVSGEILFDGINITSVEQQWLGKQIGYVPQNLSLPRATIEEVICQHEQCKKDAVIKASKMAGVHQTILSLPQGYDSILSVETSQLSPGILQRIALARALYHQPKILIFDEADAYLDKSGKDNYLNLINIATKSGCTVIAATQCQQMLTKANKILLIEQGKDSFFGTFPQFQAFVNQLNQQRKVSNLFNNQ